MIIIFIEVEKKLKISIKMKEIRIIFDWLIFLQNLRYSNLSSYLINRKKILEYIIIENNYEKFMITRNERSNCFLEFIAIL